MTYASNICLYAHMIDNNGSISTYIHTYTHLTQNICTQKSRNRHTVFYIVYAYVSTQLSNSAISIYQHTYSHIHLGYFLCLSLSLRTPFWKILSFFVRSSFYSTAFFGTQPPSSCKIFLPSLVLYLTLCVTTIERRKIETTTK